MRRDDVEGGARADHGRHHAQPVLAVGVVVRHELAGGLSEREQRVCAGVGRAAGMRGSAGRGHAQCAGRLAADDDPLLALGTALAGLEAQARVVAGEPVDVAELVGPPLLIGHEQQPKLGEQLTAVAERAGGSEREHHAALHVVGAGPVQPVAVPPQGPVVVVADHGVDVAEQQQPALAGSGHPGDQVGGAAGRRAGNALDRRVRRQHRGTDRECLLGAAEIAGGRGDRDERFQLALGERGDPLGGSGYELVHPRSVRYSRSASRARVLLARPVGSSSPPAWSFSSAPTADLVNWAPTRRVHSATASSTLLAGRYGRPLVITSQASATASSAAPSGISCAVSPRG